MKTDIYGAGIIVSGWSDIKKLIRDRYGLSEISYLTWIHNLSLKNVGPEAVIIAIPSDNQYVKVYMEIKFTDCFKDIFKELTGKDYEAEFVLSS